MPSTQSTDSTLTLRVTDLSRAGAGVAKDANGRVVFIPYTAPGDLVEAKIIIDPRAKGKANYANAELVKILEPSPQRVKPPCPIFGKCGGCQWQHLPYALQWSTKLGGVKHALTRTQVPSPAVWEELPAERIWEYRNRIQLRGERGTLGFYAAKSHDLMATDRCEIARTEINQAWEATRAEARTKPTDRPYKVEVEVLDNGSIRRTWNAAHGAAGFRQVHDEQNLVLQNWVARQFAEGGTVSKSDSLAGSGSLSRNDSVASSSSERRPTELLDLYGGGGNLSRALTGRFSRIDCVDVGAPKVRPDGTPANLFFHPHPTDKWLFRKLRADGIRLEDYTQPGSSATGRSATVRAAIIDPPREGLGQEGTEIIASLEALGVREVVAVGCDPDSWARDLSRFVKRGWKLERAAVLDLFPQTPHVESLGFLTRK